jgi:hypothetical protein
MAAMAAESITDIPVQDIGSTGTVGALIWLAVTARNAYRDYVADRATRDERAKQDRKARADHCAEEKAHWLRVEVAFGQFPPPSTPPPPAGHTPQSGFRVH